MKDTNTFSLCVCVQEVSPSRQCNYTLPSHPTLLFSFRVQRASETLLYETNSFGVTLLVPSLLCGLLHDVFQPVSAHPHPHWNLLWNAQPRLPFCDMKLTLFCVSTASGLLHDVFQDVSAHSHPHWNLLWNAQRRGITDTFCVCKKKKLHRRTSSILDRT